MSNSKASIDYPAVSVPQEFHVTLTMAFLALDVIDLITACDATLNDLSMVTNMGEDLTGGEKEVAID